MTRLSASGHKVQAHSAHPPRRRHADVGASFSALVQLSSIKTGQSWGWGRRPTASCAAPINEHTARWRHGSWLPQHASVPLPLAPAARTVTPLLHVAAST